ncbi:hypothetical protein ACIBG8_12455 [Nonomuraea sp. NPDC050556]|uniref:hypothetical protein n=1 Tax=Nonomuraea sp. NPDC050556 TaxID=3364369 RepID=UPI00378F7761
MSRTTKRLACGAALVLGLTACGPVRQAATQAPARHPKSAEKEPQGLVTGPSSSALPVEARNIRLLRSGRSELALRFDLFNGAAKRISFGDLGLDDRERLLALVDPQRGTAYSPRVSEDTDIEPGQSAPLTAVFPAPPEDATELLVVADGLLPVMVPIEDGDPVPAGTEREGETGALVCATTGRTGATYRLPSDVLFKGDGATLSPAARAAIDALRERVTSTSGQVTVDGRHLSEQRAAAVNDALRESLGDDFTYRTAGHGGRAQNRRVDVTVASGENALGRRSDTTDLSDAGLVAEVASVRRLAGYVLASVKVTNPTAAPLALDYDNHYTPKELTTGQLSLAGEQARYDVCGFAEPTYFDFVGTLSQRFAPGKLGSLPPDASVTLWGLFPAPATSSVQVEIAGFADTLTADISPG